MIFLITGSLFISVALVTALVCYPLLMRRANIEDRLARIGTLQTGKPTLVAEKSPLQKWLAQIGTSLPLQAKEFFTYGKLLPAAGFKKDTYYAWAGSKVLCAAGLPGLYIFFYALPKGVLLQFFTILSIFVLAITGFLLPTFWLRYMVDKRRSIICQTLPDILDLLVVCVESGLSIDAALIRTADNPLFKNNPLTQEIKAAVMETRAGKPRSEALKDMADRTMVDDIKSFVMMLIQTEKFGTSLGPAMRIHAGSLRTKRKLAAEEAAAKTAVKIMFPLIFFIFPALMIVVLGPAVSKLNVMMK